MSKNPKLLREVFEKIHRGNKNIKLTLFGLLGTLLGIYYYLHILHIFEITYIKDSFFLKLFPPAVIILGLLCFFAGLGVFAHKPHFNQH